MEQNRPIRLLTDNVREPAMHFSIEEAILRAIDEGNAPPTLRIRRSVPAIWIGTFQRPEEDVDCDLCRQYGIPIMRRYNPGGAVYQDEGTLCYSLFFPKTELFTRLSAKAPEDLYQVFGAVAMHALKHAGVSAELAPYNDVLVNGKKVYGSAQVEYYGAFVHSGTFLVTCNLDRMAELLRPSKLKYIDRGYTDVRNRVANIADFTSMPITPDLFARSLIQSFGEVLGFTFYEAGLSDEEHALAQKLQKEKYAKPEWTFRKVAHVSKIVSKKLSKGVLTLAIGLEQDTITTLEIRGDFLFSDTGLVSRLEAHLKGKTIADALHAVKDFGSIVPSGAPGGPSGDRPGGFDGEKVACWHMSGVIANQPSANFVELQNAIRQILEELL